MTESRATRAARAGAGTPHTAGSDLVTAPALAAVRRYPSLEAVDAAMEEGSATYRRDGNESVRLLESALADLERAGDVVPQARVTASGQAALLLGIATLCTPERRRVVLVRPCYGGTEALLTGPLAALGITMTPVDLTPGMAVAAQPEAVAAVMAPDVAAVVVEVITNPLLQVADIAAIAGVAHDLGAALLVDATFATPFLCRPFEHGADAVMHSLTKHLNGHSDVLGGVLLMDPRHSAAGRLGTWSRELGAVLGPFDAWLVLRGLRTAALRITRGSESATHLATALRSHPAVRAVHHPGSHGDDEEALCATLLPDGRGPMLSIDVGDEPAASRVIRRLDGIALAPSLGDVATTVSHPALTSHRNWTQAQRTALGIGGGLLRFSIGIEEVADLEAELSAALDAV